jgi:hypothetical protein
MNLSGFGEKYAQGILALAGVLVGWFISFLTTGFWRWRDARIRAKTIRLAFRGEISALRMALHVDAVSAKRDPPNDVRLVSKTYPRTVYEAHAGRIGDLWDDELVWQIVQFYSLLPRLEAIAAGSDIPDPGPAELLRVLAACLELATVTDVVLVADTRKGGVTENFAKEVEEDRKLATELRQKAGGRA